MEQQGTSSALPSPRKATERPGGLPARTGPPAGRSRPLLLAAFALIAFLGAGAAWFILPGLRGARPDLVIHVVKRETLVQTIVERGEMSSAENYDIICLVNHEALANSKTSIKKLKEDGSFVEKGEVVMLLDSAKLEDLLRTQGIARANAENAYIFAEANLKIVTKKAATDLATAQRTAELAADALKAYKDGNYPALLVDINSRILQGEADLEQHRDYSAYVERQVTKKFMSASQGQAARSKLLGAELAMQKLQVDKRVLTEFTGPSEIKRLQGLLDDALGIHDKLKIETKALIVQADNDMKTKKSLFDQESTKYKDIEAEIVKCTIRAPRTGLLAYYQSVQSRRGSGQSQGIVAEGEQVQLGQKLMQIPDLSDMIIKTNVHEALVGKVHAGQRAVIKPHAFRNALKGKVKSVANLAAQQDWFSGDVKVYEAVVEVEDEIEGLKPGMSAEVTIFTDVRAENVLSVPVQAIVRFAEDGRTRHRVYVRRGLDVEAREVEVGISNERMVEIKEGLSEGDEVVLNVDVLRGGATDGGTQLKPGRGGEQGAYPGGPGGGRPGGQGGQRGPGGINPGAAPGGPGAAAPQAPAAPGGRGSPAGGPPTR